MELIPVDIGNTDTAYRAGLCQQLEQGNILLLEQTPFLPLPADGEFLRTQKQSQRASHKNIAYKPHLKRTTGTGTLEAEDAERLRTVLAAYSEGALEFLSALFPTYAREWKVDYASFRPVEEEGGNCLSATVTTCCIWMRFPPGPRTVGAFYARSPT